MFLSTGQASRELSTSPSKLRVLCETGNVKAEITQGGQFRIAFRQRQGRRRFGTRRCGLAQTVGQQDGFGVFGVHRFSRFFAEIEVVVPR